MFFFNLQFEFNNAFNVFIKIVLNKFKFDFVLRKLIVLIDEKKTNYYVKIKRCSNLISTRNNKRCKFRQRLNKNLIR